MYKAVAFNCSPRRNGNTNLLLGKVNETLEKEGIVTETVHVGGRPVSGCRACMWCAENQVRRCVNDGDFVNAAIEKMIEADIILIGAPVYFGSLNTEAKALIDRAGYVARKNKNMFRRKIGAPVIALRRAGALPAADAIYHFFLLSEMVMTGASYWNMGFGREPGEAAGDAEGISNMVSLGENLAWLVKKIKPRG